MSVRADSQDQDRQRRERIRKEPHRIDQQLLDHEHVKLEGGRAKAAALFPDELCMQMCKGLKEQIEYDAKGLKRLGELSKKGTEDLIRDMVETANDFIDENFVDETTGSLGDLPPCLLKAREQMSEINTLLKPSSKPKPISQVRGTWADIEDTDDENDPLLRGMNSGRPVSKWDQSPAEVS